MNLNRDLTRKIMLGGVSVLCTLSLGLSIFTLYKVDNFARPPKPEAHGPEAHCEMRCNHDHGPKHDHEPRRNQGSMHDHELEHDKEPNHEHGPKPKKDQDLPKEDFSKEKESADTTSGEEKKD